MAKTALTNIRFQFLNDPDSDQIRQIAALYYAEGWMTAEEAEAHKLVVKIVGGSHCFLTASAGDAIIGMGRSISDRISDAYIQDVTVKKEYRHRGLGSKIIQSLVERLQADGIKWIGLIAERGTHDFYSRIGFEKMSNAMPMLRKM